MNLIPRGGYRYAKRVRVLLQRSKLVPQGGSQKSKELYSKLLHYLKWSVYLRRAVLARASKSTIFSPTPNFVILYSSSTFINFHYKSLK